MELNWTTFILEVINFLVLVWLLKRFLYKPVRETVERRRQAIEDDLAAARDKKQQAQQLLEEQQQKMEQWEDQQEQAKARLQTFIDSERERRLTELNDDLVKEVERRKALQDHQHKEQWRELERRAMELSSSFASQLLSRFSGVELEQLIIAAMLEDLQQLPAEQLEKLQKALVSGRAVSVVTTNPLQQTVRQQLEQTLQALAGQELADIRYEQDSALVCGIRIAVESMQVNANLASELRFFTEGHACG